MAKWINSDGESIYNSMSTRQVVEDYVGDTDMRPVLYRMAYLADDITRSRALLQSMMVPVQARCDAPSGPSEEDGALHAALNVALEFLDAAEAFQKSDRPMFRMAALGEQVYIGTGKHSDGHVRLRHVKTGGEVYAPVAMLKPLNAAAVAMADQAK